MDVSEAKWLKGLEDENALLKRLLADAMLDNAAVKADLDLSRICAAPSARLGHLAFEGQGAFASQC